MVALVIIYNHQYNKNIPILEKLYGPRFTHIFHLVPFYNGTQENVVPVYASSYYFEGYVAQGLKSYYRTEFKHYFFIADDMILHPSINETNYQEQMRLDDTSCYISRLSPLHEANTFWTMNLHAVLYNKHSPGTEAAEQLPDTEMAIALLKNFGIENKPLAFDHIWKKPANYRGWLGSSDHNRRPYLLRSIYQKLTQKKYSLNYPLVRSYADIFVVSADSIRQFCHYCGVFAATNLFVELAIPTALVFSAKSIVTEKDIAYTGRALWTKEDHAILDRYEHRLDKLLANFPENYLFIHPVKLSKWKM